MIQGNIFTKTTDVFRPDCKKKSQNFLHSVSSVNTFYQLLFMDIFTKIFQILCAPSASEHCNNEIILGLFYVDADGDAECRCRCIHTYIYSTLATPEI